ncbi:DnaD domain-containing protein [Paucilactobacillus hokkaidonensis]|uniref:DnaD domain-containing protein n=1 Tax=Paucilactobacillus hokkaidonensis TaxID=1193095 RepID=UPI000AA14E8C|nr:DnaD domain protein [Paucilactobacillus hokkaidonensis]
MEEREASFMNRFVGAGQTVINNLILHHYRQIGMTTAQLMVYLQLKSYIDRGIPSPDINVIAQNLGTQATQVYELMHQMIEQKLMTHKTQVDEAGKQSDYYDFSILLEKLAQLDQQKETKVEEVKQDNQRSDVFDKIEVEFGRPLSPIEMETVSKWIDEDHYSVDLILIALQEAVLNQVWNLKYMDRILRSWEKQHITTTQQIDQQRKK